MDNLINVKVNGIDVAVPAGSTILDAARAAHIDIPTLCYLKDINEIGACRLCLVEVKGARGLMTACVTTVTEGMEIFTNTKKVVDNRKMNLKLVLSTHEKKCLSCIRNQSCELQKLCAELGVEDEDSYQGTKIHYELDESSASLVRDNNKCILCRRCIAACNTLQGIGVINSLDRGFDTHIASPFDEPLASQACVNCGQCVVACPVGALYEKDDTQKVWDALSDPNKHVAICCAPSIRATIGECFGFAPGVDTEGKMVAAVKRLGFDGVYDMNLTADLTIMEEATEFIERVTNGGTLPMITSCSPGWIKFCEHYFPEFTDNLSTCKSPQQMFGAMYKTYYAKKAGLDPSDIVFISAIPCTAKKFECRRPGEDAAGNGIFDVDYAITTRELARMIEKAGIDYRNLPDEKFDEPFDIGSGAGAIFGATGGVMEAALRMAAEVILGKKLEKVDFTDVRGTDPIKFATYKLGDLTVRVAVTSGTKNAKELLNKVKSGEVQVDFIEVMCCPGGCVNGGGQPVQSAKVKATVDLKKERASILYNADKNMAIRKSQDNPAILKIYDEYLGKPGSELAHEILHTYYIKRGVYNNK